MPSVVGQANQNIIFKAPGIRLYEWLGFRDTFESLIHNNDTISPIQKFHYLKTALEDTAAHY